MILHDFGKLGLIALVIVGIFAAVLVGEIDFDQALPLLTAITGYLFGNGLVAARGRAPSPMIVTKVEPGDVATTTGTVNAAELAQLGDELRQADEHADQSGVFEIPRRPGEHTTGEHFLATWPPPRPEEGPRTWSAPIPPAAPSAIDWQIPLEPAPAQAHRLPPYDVGPMPIDPARLDQGPPSAEAVDVAEPEPVEFGTGHEAMCRCGHPRLHHVESESHPATFLWCTNTSPAIAAGTIEARCACNLFALGELAPEHADFWQPREESHGQAPR